ncbi:hypothetical protein EV361DRAFT_810161 [Lentinula raphanica]|uniref:DUF1279 domain-containing protein n=1 Tax=Lentinula raphanica TaxID=153919 RepID=A0AA38U876_9AGAR|nr:hypothetical protein F5880DRAFT_1613159 [Lentinula raphanica]KAJ3833385.1 hypothetical protein F5878DRAFT_408654 [Lentinula raphanica]KAJ3965763.1 hypothetical protein EV361DRAFT_810161 [Lentinula raphanica]
MLSRFFLRLPIRFVPRVTAPLLPVSRFRQPTSSPTHTPRSQSRLFSNFPARLNSSSPSRGSSPTTQPSDENVSFSQRLKHLIKSYGWYALGVYLVIGAVDFAVAFAAINLIGAEQVSQIAASVKESVASVIHSRPPEPGKEELDPINGGIPSGNEGLYAMIVLAYTIHKTLFLPVRVGFTAAFTPRLVNWLRSRGWAGGAGARRAAEEMKEKFRNARRK